MTIEPRWAADRPSFRARREARDGERREARDGERERRGTESGEGAHLRGERAVLRRGERLREVLRARTLLRRLLLRRIARGLRREAWRDVVRCSVHRLEKVRLHCCLDNDYLYPN